MCWESFCLPCWLQLTHVFIGIRVRKRRKKLSFDINECYENHSVFHADCNYLMSSLAFASEREERNYLLISTNLNVMSFILFFMLIAVSSCLHRHLSLKEKKETLFWSQLTSKKAAMILTPNFKPWKISPLIIKNECQSYSITRQITLRTFSE